MNSATVDIANATNTEDSHADSNKPSREQAMEAVRTLLAWVGDNPEREGLQDTPARVIKAYDEFFAGYTQDPDAILSRTFEEVEGYDEIVSVKNIRLESHCEHHMVPFIGTAHVGYIPDKRIVGISKLARVVDVYAKRLQTQEALTAQVADSIKRCLEPKGVAVVIDAEHMCMSARGVHKAETSTVTSRMLGVFRKDPRTRMEFMSLIGKTGYMG